MDVEKLITHLRYGTPYHGDVQRDTLDALERLGEAEARYEALQESVAELPELDDLIGAVDHLRVYVAEDDTDHGEAIDDVSEKLCAVRDAIEELRA